VQYPPVVVGSASEEDDLDRYRYAVERLLGDDLVLDDEADVEAFFEFVIACYDAGETPSDCARRWLGEARERKGGR
jgi:hypothetical protein